ncbi:VWA domain-containing protein, partial [bacterium]|nr:VWA domain-containing protein [bacterium]
MKKIVISLCFIAICALLFNLKGASETNYDYKVYNPSDLTEVSKSVQRAQPDSQILFIVDFSNSMNDTIRGKAKVDIARTTLAEILPKIPKNIKTGLRVYGHKAGFTYVQGCTASNLAVPLAPNNAQNILSSLYAMRATGWTPITYSLKQAINNDFHGTTGKKHIILLTDGGENCDESPCTYVINLMKTRNDV